MKYLLDTHTFLWTVLGTARLSKKAKSIILNGNNEIFVSSISFWEIAIKEQIGKLNLKNLDSNLLPEIAKEYSFEILNPSPDDFISYKNLPIKKTHRDPFDRMIIHLSIRGDFFLISKDSEFEQYKSDGLKIFW